MRGLPQKQNARRADKIRLCGHLGRYKKIVKKAYIIYYKNNQNITIIQDIQEGLCVQQLLIKLKISIWEEH